MNLRFVFSLIVSLLSLLPAAAQDLTRNWIRERIFLDAEGKECVTSVQYFDGIGRETLLLTDGLSPGGDVAGALTGESFAGRTSAKWLPATGLTGFDFLTPERVKSLAVSSHEGDRKHMETTAFDANGNITRLVRWADYAPMLNTAADVLYYTLDGNRPLSISDRGVNLAYAGSFDFKNRGRSGEYAYDGNGRLVSDPYKGMTVTYADWGTPEKITFDDGNHTAFTYTASGEKLKTEWRSGAANLRAGEGSPAVQAAVINSEELFGPFVCRDGRLDKFLFDGGFCDLSSGGAKYRYFVRDRLGSVRSVADEDGNVLQQNLYYAQGGAWGDVCTAPGFQSYKYCGKYLDRKHGLDLYDYGARLYDPAAAFWTSPDPLCEKYYNISPYAFCNNNPVTFIDPDGRDGVLLVDNQSNTITVRANYYMETKERISKEGNKIVQYSENQIASMNKNVNEYLNALGLKVSEGEYTGYSIVFALKFINGGSQTETTRLAGNDYFNYPGYQEVRIGNKIYRMDNTHERIIQKVYADGTTETVGGLAERNEIMMNVEYDTFNNRIHEIFHTFGFEDIKKWKIGHGIMNIPPETPNQQDADLLINNGFLPKIILR